MLTLEPIADDFTKLESPCGAETIESSPLAWSQVQPIDEDHTDELEVDSGVGIYSRLWLCGKVVLGECRTQFLRLLSVAIMSSQIR